MFWPEPTPDRFWGPEQLSAGAYRELVERIDARAEIDAVMRALVDMRTVVDVGGGTGFLTQQIAARTQVIAIEPSAEQRAHVPHGIEVREGKAEALPLNDKAVDCAIATWVLQYCDDPLRAIDELARVARRRVVIVQAAPGNDLVEVYNREASVAGLPRAHHGYLISHATRVLDKAGFCVALYRVPIPVRVDDAHALADVLSRLHFDGHPKRADMIAATEPFIRARGARLADDGAVLVASRV